MSREQTVFDFAHAATPGDWLLWGAVALGLLAWTTWLYRRDTRGLHPALRLALGTLRCSAMVVLLWVLLGPQVRTDVKTRRDSRVVVAADVSLSMSSRDVAEGSTRRSRADHLLATLAEGDLLARLRRTHEVHLYSFGRTAELLATLPKGAEPPAPELAEILRPAADQTRLGDALTDILREQAAAPLAGVVLLTDGRGNAGGPAAPATGLAVRSRTPVFAVGYGSEAPPLNLRIVDLQAPAQVFAGDDFRVRALVQAVGDAPAAVPVELVRGDGAEREVVATRDVPLAEGAGVAEFTLTPEEVGRYTLTARTAVLPDEINERDNAALGAYEVVDRQTRVLLFSSGPGRDYRFLRNLLFRDASMSVDVLLQTAQDGVSQEADQVLREFPAGKEELFVYDVIVALDPDWSRLDDAQVADTVEWVGRQAGGLVAVAGPVETPRLARADRLGPIRELYPVRLREIFASELDSAQMAEPWPLEFTAEGRAAAYLRLGEENAAEGASWDDFAGFYWTYPSAGVRPGASVLATFSDPRAAAGGVAPPALATQFYGAGRVLFVGSTETWRLRRLGEKTFDRFWVRLIRQMGQQRLLRGSRRATLVLEQSEYPLGARISVVAQVQDAQFRPLVAPGVPLTVTEPDGATRTVTLAAQVGKPGSFEGSLPARQPGETTLQLLPGPDAEPVTRRLRVRVPALEFDDPRLNVPLLTTLAERTGGRLLAPDDLATLPDLLEDRTETTYQTGTPRPLWDRGWLMLLFVGLLALEWLLRKLLTLA